MNFFYRVVEMARTRFFHSDGKRDADAVDDTFRSARERTAATPPSRSNMVTPLPNVNIRAPPSAPRRQTVAPRLLRPPRIAEVRLTGVVEEEQPTTARSYHPFQLQIARNLIDFTRGYPNTRNHHRRQIQTKVKAPRLSSGHPQFYPNSFADERIRPHFFDVVMKQSPASAEIVHMHAWNPQDRSLNIYVKEDQITLHRYPVPKSTDGIRGKIGFSRGFHVWEIVWPEKQRGTHPVLGVSVKNSSLHCSGYGSLLGLNTDSYGWDINALRCYHDTKNSKSWSYPTERPSDYVVPSVIYCILDMEEGYLAFATPKEYLGIAFRGLCGKTLYPTVSAVWGQCEITMRYIGGLKPVPRLLVDVCRKNVRAQMGETRLDRIGELELPRELERYLNGR